MTLAPTRSLFIPKLHDLLQASTLDGSQDLCWLNTDSFQISSNDAAARTALAPSWEFRSLSSFIRQLSYYGFTRLSDRRRSSARRTAVACKTIVFAHPSGHFIENDATRLHLIIRKCRARKSDKDSGSGKRRKSSVITAASRSKSPEQLLASPGNEEGDELDERDDYQMMTGDGTIEGDDYVAFLKSRQNQEMEDWDRNRSSFDSVGSGVDSMYSHSQPQSPTLPYYSVNYQDNEIPPYRSKFQYSSEQFSHYPPPLIGYDNQAYAPPHHYLPTPEIYTPSHLPQSSYIHHPLQSHDQQFHHDIPHPLHSASGNTVYQNREYHLESYSINHSYSLPEKTLQTAPLSPRELEEIQCSPKQEQDQENHYFEENDQPDRIPRSILQHPQYELDSYAPIHHQQTLPAPISY